MAAPKESYQSRLILDSGKLAGSCFDRSVVLICRHNESGSFGLVLSRPLKQTLGASVNAPLEEDLAKAPLHLGGPVQPEFLSYLLETEVQPEFEILPWLRLGHSLDELRQQFASHEKNMRLRVFAGYAGWAAGQLESEMKSGCWITLASSISRVFYPHPENLWRHLLCEMGGIFRILAQCPDNPALN